MFPTREQLENKRWHRFFRVFLVVSTALLSIILLNTVTSNTSEWSKTRYIYSFEPDFNKYEGQEKDCSIMYDIVIPYGAVVPANMSVYEKTEKYSIPKSLQCGNLNQFNFITYYCDTSPLSPVCSSNISDLKTLGNFLKQQGIRSKEIGYVNWGIVFRDLALAAGYIIGWIVLLKCGIYKAVLYIVYGRNGQR